MRLIRMLLNGFKMIYCWIKVEVAHYLNTHAVNKNDTKRFWNDVLLNHTGMCGDSVFMEFVGTLTVEMTSSVSTVFNYHEITSRRTFENCPKTQKPNHPLPTPNKKNDLKLWSQNFNNNIKSRNTCMRIIKGMRLPISTLLEYYGIVWSISDLTWIVF